MYSAMTTVTGGRRSVGAVLGDALLGEQGSAVEHEPDHPDDRHEGQGGDDQHLPSGGVWR